MLTAVQSEDSVKVVYPVVILEVDTGAYWDNKKWIIL